eukprot:202503_1
MTIMIRIVTQEEQNGGRSCFSSSESELAPKGIVVDQSSPEFDKLSVKCIVQTEKYSRENMEEGCVPKNFVVRSAPKSQSVSAGTLPYKKRIKIAAQQASSTVQQPPSEVQQSTSAVQQSPSAVHQSPSAVQQSSLVARSSSLTVRSSPSTVNQYSSTVHQSAPAAPPNKWKRKEPVSMSSVCSSIINSFEDCPSVVNTVNPLHIRKRRNVQVAVTPSSLDLCSSQFKQSLSIVQLSPSAARPSPSTLQLSSSKAKHSLSSVRRHPLAKSILKRRKMNAAVTLSHSLEPGLPTVLQSSSAVQKSSSSVRIYSSSVESPNNSNSFAVQSSSLAVRHPSLSKMILKRRKINAAVTLSPSLEPGLSAVQQSSSAVQQSPSTVHHSSSFQSPNNRKNKVTKSSSSS